MSRQLIFKYVTVLVSIINTNIDNMEISLLIAQYISDFVATFAEPKTIIYPNISSQNNQSWLKSIKTNKYHIIMAKSSLSPVYFIKVIRAKLTKNGKKKYWQFEFNDCNLIKESIVDKKSMIVKREHNNPIWDIEEFACPELLNIIENVVDIIDYENLVFKDISMNKHLLIKKSSKS
jgi:hypothetical protein